MIFKIIRLQNKKIDSCESILYSNMGRRMRIELMHTGATNQRVNHFINAAITDADIALAVDIADDAFAQVAKAHGME